MAHLFCMQNTDIPKTVPSFLSKSATSPRRILSPRTFSEESKAFHIHLLSTESPLTHSQEATEISNLLNVNSQDSSFSSSENSNLRRVIELKNSYILKLETENYSLTLENSQLREKLGHLSSLNTESHCKFLKLQSKLISRSETIKLLKTELTSVETSRKEEINEVYLQEHSKVSFQSRELDRLHPQL